MLAPDPTQRAVRTEGREPTLGIGTRNENQAQEPLAGVAWELGQVGQKGNPLLSTYCKPGAWGQLVFISAKK